MDHGTSGLGQWLPGSRRTYHENQLIQVTLPFTDLYRWGMHSEETSIPRPDDLARLQSQKILLVYPPAHARAALKSATSADYRQAMALLDKGEVKAALDLLLRDLQNNPRHGFLAQEIIDICDAAELPELAAKLARQAVENGAQVPELLLRHADSIARNDAKKALAYYRQAAHGEFAPAEVFIKLGKHYETLSQRHLAESCWRRAHRNATEPQHQEIRRWLGMEEQKPQLGLR